MQHILISTIVGALVASSAVPATATIRYLGTRAVGAGTVDLSIDTDGRIGALVASDIVDWTVTLRDPTSAFPVRSLTSGGAGGSIRSSVVIGGPSLTATPTALSFDYGAGSFEFDANYTVRPFYQLVSSLCSTGAFGNAGGCEQFDTGSDYASQHIQYTLHPGSGRIVIATAAAVAEPATWSLMIIGFGLAGWTIRRRAHELHGVV